MTACNTLETKAEAHASAVRRLRRAQEELRRVNSARGVAMRPSGERSTENTVSACAAALAAREEWLYWVDHKRSRHPEADGDWASLEGPPVAAR